MEEWKETGPSAHLYGELCRLHRIFLPCGNLHDSCTHCLGDCASPCSQEMACEDNIAFYKPGRRFSKN